MTSIKEQGPEAPTAYFTGTVHVNLAVTPEDKLNVGLGKVTFDAKARTNWHTHPYGQILIVTDGIGYYQGKGKSVQIIKKDDVVKIPKNVEHWHGASHQNSMTHIAIVPSDTNATVWMQAVSDEAYDKALTDEKSAVTISEKAHQNHNQLWPEYQSNFAQTDPELIQVFDNFAFDEIVGHDNLDVKTRTLMILASTIASQSVTEYKMFANAALNVGATPVEVKEILYQSVPYVGISKVIDFVKATNDIFRERDINLPVEPQSTTNPQTRHEKGLAKQKEIFGDRIDDMYKNAPDDLLHFQHYLSANCFGDYVTRNGLDVQIRELATLSFLIALGGTENQIKGHIQGNANVGNGRQKLIDLMTQLLPYVGYPRTLNAVNCLNEILPPKK
ncbi:cupin domain-containing carboxymuconolactone decarboxylase family protein [Flavobacterium silvaticum]|uniref:Cupin domain-containing protein n=1 Tax=Flavobacterium silvaticum TaxID=1852020 RepID=A0A972JI56_9FLAO|nr:carboxymuconolactone decarboxylase family protein [Flavobacterium silvaticum]NMH28650.1 cupin domain-containing protein [Flavobacterium silvaticum]